MNVTAENLGACKRLLRVEVEPEKVEEAFKTVAAQFQREVRLPGFRPGKAPKDMVAKRFENEIQEEVKRKLISESFKSAVTEQKLTLVGRPEVEEIQFTRGQPLQFAANVEIAPEFELPEYKGLSGRARNRQRHARGHRAGAARCWPSARCNTRPWRAN